MKISKLFHWLYAFLMFLPILALAPSLFYFAFNQQSQNYTEVQVNETYEYETNEVNSISDLVVGNIYHFEMNEYTPTEGDYFRIDISALYHVDFTSQNPLLATYQSGCFVSLYNIGSLLITFPIDSQVVDYIGYRSPNLETFSVSCDFVFSAYLYGNIDVAPYISASDYLGEKNVEVVRSEQSPMNIFYTAVSYVYDMPVFSWAKNSFLALPITYVTGLFGMASTNVVNYYLSYWLAISIVYLVFDLVMYVPLLVHRWIDKGMIE